jgi:hypothetical protein
MIGDDISRTLRRLFNALRTTTAWGLWRRFALNHRGNVALIAAFGMIPVTLTVGIGYDYVIQKRGQEQLDGVADAAVLIPTTPSMMTQSAATAQAAANAFWQAQSSGVFNVTVTPSTTGPVSVIDTVNGTVRTRTVTINWSGTSATYLSSLVGLATLPLQGTSQSTASSAPNINFYLLVDTSPSMAIAATTAGINTMVS